MIRLSWLQFRVQAVVAVCALAVVGVAFAVTGPGVAHLYSTLVAPCKSQGDCGQVVNEFLAKDPLLQAIGIVLVIVPAVVGVFWGAPLVARELETGTFRLVWTQSVTRMRWLVTKLAFVGLASTAVAGLLSLMVTWWASPFDKITADRFSMGAFSERGVVPMGYAAFGFALGVTAGVLIRRTVPAMTATIFVFLGARLAEVFCIRPHLMPPVVQDIALSRASLDFGITNGGPLVLQANPPNIANSWVYSSRVVDAHGNAPTSAALMRVCPNLPRPGNQGAITSSRIVAPGHARSLIHACIVKLNTVYHEAVTLQPPSRYWPFQWLETGLFVMLALALAGFCIWWVRRRLT
jgi:ABC-2 family transporter protein